MMMSDQLQETQNQLTLFVADSPVKTCQFSENARDWLGNGRDSGTSMQELFARLNQDGLNPPLWYWCIVAVVLIALYVWVDRTDNNHPTGYA